MKNLKVVFHSERTRPRLSIGRVRRGHLGRDFLHRRGRVRLLAERGERSAHSPKAGLEPVDRGRKAVDSESFLFYNKLLSKGIAR